MARKRKGSEQNVDSPTKERKGNMAMDPLSPEAIQELLSTSRQRGAYDDALKQFVETGEAGVRVDLTGGQFSGKKPQSVKTGFESARKREGAPEDAQHVRVIVQEENVYLIRTDLQ